MAYNYDNIISAVDAPDGKEHKIKQYQNTGDIIKDLVYCFKTYNYQAKPIAKMYYTGNIKKDGENIYNFIKNNIQYRAEPEENQTTRSINRILHDKWGDCKHTAELVGSIAFNMGYTVIFKFVNYEDYTKHFGHVYAIIEDTKTNERIIVDTLQDFNYQKPYKKATNYKFINSKNMALSRLTGVDDINGVDENELNGIGETFELSGIGSVQFISGSDLDSVGKAKKAIAKPLFKPTPAARANPIRTAAAAVKAPVKTAKQVTTAAKAKPAKFKARAAAKKVDRKAAKAPKKAARKTKTANLKAKIKSRGGIVKTVALAPVRAAGTVLIHSNFRGFASRLKTLQERNPSKVTDFAKKFGYKPDFLAKQIATGSKKKPLFGSKANGIAGIDDVVEIAGIGAVSVAAAVTTAAPLILALTQLLKGEGLEEPSDAAALRESAQNIVNETPDVSEVENDEPEQEQEAEQEAEQEQEQEAEQEQEDTTGMDGLQKKRKKFVTALTKVDAATKAVSKGVSTYKASTAPQIAVKVPKQDAVPKEAMSFFETAKQSFQDKPLVWLGATGALVLIGNQIFKK